MKKIIKILIIVIPIIIIIATITIISIMSLKKEAIKIDEALIQLTCNSVTYYNDNKKEFLNKQLKKGQLADCSVSVSSPKKKELTFNDISFDYTIDGNYITEKEPSTVAGDGTLLINSKRIHINYMKDHTVNKNAKYETIFETLYTFKIRIPDSDNSNDKLTFNLSNVKIESHKKIYTAKDYSISYDIIKDSP